MKRSRRYQEIALKVDHEKAYAPEEAIKLVKSLGNAKFDETLEVHFNLGIDPKYPEQQLRGTLSLPGGSGKETRVLAIVNPEQVEEAKAAGADYAGSEDVIEKIAGGWLDFDLVIATPDMMSKVGKLGRALGTKGLMPNPKSGTVSPNITETVKEFKGGKLEYRNDKAGNLHSRMGKVSFDEADLLQNFNEIFDTILKVKPAKAKGIYMKSISINTTMGPGVNIETQKLRWKS